MCKTTYSPVGRNGCIPDHANMLVHCQMVAKGFGKALQLKKYMHVYIWKCCRIRAQSLLLCRRCTRTFLGRATSRVILVNILFRFLIFYDTIIFASLSKYLSKNVLVVIQVVNNKKVLAKTPREANLYGNWCVRKGLRWSIYEPAHAKRAIRSELIKFCQTWDFGTTAFQRPSGVERNKAHQKSDKLPR